MNSTSDYILILTDELRENLTGRIPAGMVGVKMMDTGDWEGIVSLCNSNTPKVIIIYMSKPDPGYVSSLKTLRGKMEMDSVPVMVFSRMPTERDIHTLLS